MSKRPRRHVQTGQTEQGPGRQSDETSADEPTSIAAADQKAAILVEALPYIRRFWGKVVVVKYGGNALLRPRATAPVAGDVRRAQVPRDVAEARAVEPTAAYSTTQPAEMDALASFAEDIVLMRSVGMLPVVVHGGGPQIGQLMSRLGKVPEFRDGMRVTDAETLEIARMVLVGKVNREIVSAMNVHGSLAVGLSGEDANLITAVPRPGGLGFVGDVEVVDPSMIERLLTQGLIPVVATVAADSTGQAYNINADSVAGALAVVLRAEKLVFLTDTEGLRADPQEPGSLLRTVTADALDAMVASGAASAGMVPKVEACAAAVRAGVARAHILDGRVPHALLLEVFTDEGVGTMVSAGPDSSVGSASSDAEVGSAVADGAAGARRRVEPLPAPHIEGTSRRSRITEEVDL